jgi:2'-5' RNA ligase
MPRTDSRTDRDEREPKRRLFFALWPDQETRAAVVRATREVVQRSAGRATPAENLHVTLAFLGDVGESEFAQLQHIPPPLIGAFELQIDTLDFRKRPRLLWAVPETLPAALSGLESWLWGRLEDLGIERERRAYRPHVTLARRANYVGDPLAPLSWPVTGFVLVQSSLGPPHSSYEIVKTWPLRP